MASSNTIGKDFFLAQRFKVRSLYNQDRLYYYYPTQEACENCQLGYGKNVHKTLYVFVAPWRLKNNLDAVLQNLEKSFEFIRLYNKPLTTKLEGSMSQYKNGLVDVLRKRIYSALAYRKIKDVDLQDVFQIVNGASVVNYTKLEDLVVKYPLEKSSYQRVCGGSHPSSDQTQI